MRRSKDLFSSEFFFFFFLDHHQLSAMVELFASLTVWIIVAATLSSSSAGHFLRVPPNRNCDDILLVFHKQKLQTATEMNLSRQTESSAFSLTSRICSSQPYSNVSQEFAIIFYYCHQCFCEDTLDSINGISGSKWQRSACRVFSKPSHLEHHRLQWIIFFEYQSRNTNWFDSFPPLL